MRTANFYRVLLNFRAITSVCMQGNNPKPGEGKIPKRLENKVFIPTSHTGKIQNSKDARQHPLHSLAQAVENN